MAAMHKAGRYGVAALAAFALVFGTVVLLWAVYPYDGVRVGESAVAGPLEVPVGGTVSWVNADYCNDGYDVLATRWADRWVDGRVSVSYSLPPVEFFVDEPFCASSLPTNSILPNYVKPGVYVIRTVLIYSPNPLFTRSVEVDSPAFTVTP